jgi:hypothetical protein
VLHYYRQFLVLSKPLYNTSPPENVTRRFGTGSIAGTTPRCMPGL